MFSWIGDHLVAIVLLVAFLYSARSILDWLSGIGKKTNAGALATGFCNKCGWKGRIANAKQCCGRCGSLKITLRTG